MVHTYSQKATKNKLMGFKKGVAHSFKQLFLRSSSERRRANQNQKNIVWPGSAKSTQSQHCCQGADFGRTSQCHWTCFWRTSIATKKIVLAKPKEDRDPTHSDFLRTKLETVADFNQLHIPLVKTNRNNADGRNCMTSH